MKWERSYKIKKRVVYGRGGSLILMCSLEVREHPKAHALTAWVPLPCKNKALVLEPPLKQKLHIYILFLFFIWIEKKEGGGGT